MPNAHQRRLVDLTVPYEAPPYTPAATAVSARRRRWPLLLGAAGIVFVLGLLLAAAASLWWLGGRTIAPGVYVLGLDLGGQTRATAADQLEAAWAAQMVTLVGTDLSQAMRPGELGLQLNAAASARRAQQQTRSFESLLDWVRGGGQLALSPVWTFDPSTAEAALEALRPQVDRAAVDAGVRLVAGQPETTESRPGRRLNVEATLAALAHDPGAALAQRRLELVVDTVDPAVVDAGPALAAVERLLSTPLTLQLDDPVSGQTRLVPLGPELWGAWLTIDAVDPAGGDINWQLNEAALRTYLSDGADFLDPGAYVDANSAATAVRQALADGGGSIRLRVFHAASQHIVQSGETLAAIGRAYGVPYPWIQEANPGLDQGLFPGQTITIPSQDVFLPLPVVDNKRVVVSISEQRVWVYEDGTEKWVWPASTGIDSSPTAPGIFQIQSHEPTAYAGNWDLWMPHFLGVYRPVPGSDFMNGFHGFPTRNGATLLWTGDLGHQVTFGCILLSSDNAATLFDWAEDGVVVEIRP